jgi:peptidyl-prolyl cis-trans isomerase SurA
MTMDQAIQTEAKGDAKPLYIKVGVLSAELEADVQKLSIGGYSKLIDTPDNVMFVKVVGERPSLDILFSEHYHILMMQIQKKQKPKFIKL